MRVFSRMAHYAECFGRIVLPLPNFRDIVDAWIDLQPRLISHVSYQVEALELWRVPGDALDFAVFGRTLYTRIRFARCSEDGDMLGIANTREHGSGLLTVTTIGDVRLSSVHVMWDTLLVMPETAS